MSARSISPVVPAVVVADSPAARRAKRMGLPSIDNAYDAHVLARMLIEIAQADERISAEESAWLDDMLPAGAGRVVELTSLPALTATDLAKVTAGARAGLLMHAWTIALADEELAPQEEALLAHFATGLGLSPADTERAARNRRMVLPLLRLGVDRDANRELFGFLDLCAEIPGISKIDHATFITRHEHTKDFLAYWASRGFGPHGEWNTQRYPARHLALVRGRPAGFPWEEMVGLTVTDDPASPLHRVLPSEYVDSHSMTHDLQHIAINVTPDADMNAIRTRLMEAGIQFMTPLLSYTSDTGAGLRQMFTATGGLFFIEFAQRIPNAHGEPFAGFHSGIIDDLYEALDHAEERWNMLTAEDRRIHETWLPSRVVFDPSMM